MGVGGGTSFTLNRRTALSELTIQPMLSAKDPVLHKLKIRPSMGTPSHRFAGELIG